MKFLRKVDQFRLKTFLFYSQVCPTTCRIRVYFPFVKNAPRRDNFYILPTTIIAKLFVIKQSNFNAFGSRNIRERKNDLFTKFLRNIRLKFYPSRGAVIGHFYFMEIKSVGLGVSS